MTFVNKQVEKDFKKIDWSIREVIETKLEGDPTLLKLPSQKLRGGNLGYRFKHHKYRIFYTLDENSILIYKIGEKDKNAYEGM